MGTYFRLSVVSAEPVTAGNTSAFLGYDIVGFSKVTTKSLASGTGSQELGESKRER